MRGGERRAVTPVVGNVLLVAVVVVIAISLTTLSFAFLDNTGAPTAEATFEYEQTPAGLRLVPEQLGTDVTVQLNGKPVADVAADSVGESVLVPTAPGDTISVVSQDAERSVLVTREVDDRSEVGDFIAYYTFEEPDSNGNVPDESGNGNTGITKDDPAFRTGGGDTCMEFDGTGDWVEVPDLDSSVDVSELTVAVAYRPDRGDRKQELVEHINPDGSNWLMEMKDRAPGEQYKLAYSVDKAGGSQTGQFFSSTLSANDRHVAVGTFDGQNYELFVDGTSQGSNSFASSQSVGVGSLAVARDGEAGRDYLDGEICELRLYYTAFEEDEVGAVTNAMAG
jgi:flagellin-like protein